MQESYIQKQYFILIGLRKVKKSKKKISYKSIKRNQVSFKQGIKKKNFTKILVRNSLKKRIYGRGKVWNNIGYIKR